MLKKWLCLSVATVMVFFASVSQGSASETKDTLVTEFGLIVSFTTTADGDDFVNVITKDGSIKQYRMVGNAKKEFQKLGRFSFVSYKVSNGIEIKYGVKQLIDASAGEPENVKINRTEAAKLDKITTARVDEVDGREIIYKVDDETFSYYTTTTTNFVNLFDLTTIQGVQEGDYVVLIDTDDDGSMIDHVAVVTNEDAVEEYKYDMTTFLNQQYKTVESLRTENRNITLKKGENVQVEVNAEYIDGTDENVTELVNWTSSKSGVVSVKNGKLVAKKAGKATIKAIYQKKEVTIHVTVE